MHEARLCRLDHAVTDHERRQKVVNVEGEGRQQTELLDALPGRINCVLQKTLPPQWQLRRLLLLIVNAEVELILLRGHAHRTTIYEVGVLLFFLLFILSIVGALSVTAFVVAVLVVSLL